MTFQSILPPQQLRSKDENKWPSKWTGLMTLLSLNFDFTTILLIGACCQTLLVLIIPRFYALTPAALVLLYRLSVTLLITAGFMRNPYLEGAILKKAAAVVPNEDGEFSSEPANEKVVVLHLGAKSNHPMNAFAPGFPTMGDHLDKMSQAMADSAPNNGFWGQSAWMNRDKNGAIHFNLISYWRSIEDLHDFAHGPVHREGWQWWDRTLKEHDHLGISHEIYAADKSQWENIYANFQPTGLGATTYLRRGDKLEGGTVPDQWISPLVEANKGKLRTSAGRLGWAPSTQHDNYGPNVDAV